MNAHKEEIERLLQKFKEGKCTNHEIKLIKKWWLHYQEADDANTVSSQAIQEDLASVWHRLDKGHSIQLRPYRVLRIAVAAAVILIVGGIALYYANLGDPQPERSLAADKPPSPPATYQYDVAPGGHKATLLTPDGQRIQLAEDHNGIIVDAVITYMDGQSVVHNSQAAGQNGDALYELVTPQGGTYRMKLADGTNVWLNAGSRLRYPLVFTKNDRTVYLEGEAFFEVTPDDTRRFVVKTAKETVRVLGTKFNIESYLDEDISRTTLIEGSIEIGVTTINGEITELLSPNQQSQISSQTLTIENVNVAQVIAWKDNYFRFQDHDITDIMKTLARWYSIDVIYQGEPTTEKFSGKISRDRNISEVLELLERTEAVRFEIESDKRTNERRVIVMK